MYILSGSDTVLANHILPVLRNTRQICAFNKDKGDIQDINFLNNLVDDIKPDIFINCAQLENIEECEYKREMTYSVNAFAAEKMAKICYEKNILFIHFSSSYIFDGNANQPYKEGDTANPINCYGDSKLLAEKLIIESGCRYLIIRVPDFFGKGYSFLHQFFSQIRTERRIKIIKDQMISPTYAFDAAVALQRLIELKSTGIFHFANCGIVSMIEFIINAVKLYQKYSKKDVDYNIVELNYDEFLSPAERLLYNALDPSKYVKTTGLEVRTWKEALDDFMSLYYTDL